ncbi:hypothetical protein MMC22_007539 [Lobaria immixta]|nr:hypothetical protein [Lobaria immixta]
MSAGSEVLVEIRKELDNLRIEMQLHNESRMKLFRVNILNKFVDKIYEKCIRERSEAVHETGHDMARLLMTQAYHDQSEYHKWRRIFPYVYGKTIEQMAAEGSSGSGSTEETIWTADL